MTMPPGRAGHVGIRSPEEAEAKARGYAQLLEEHKDDGLPKTREDAVRAFFAGWEYWDICEVKRWGCTKGRST